mgnify:CR=1 FL=1
MRTDIAAIVILVGLLSSGVSCERKDVGHRSYEDAPIIDYQQHRTETYLITTVKELDLVCVRPLRASEQLKHGPSGCMIYPEGMPDK